VQEYPFTEFLMIVMMCEQVVKKRQREFLVIEIGTILLVAQAPKV